MTITMDYMISSHPIRLFNPKLDASKQKIKSLTLVNAGHLPKRRPQRLNAQFSYWAFVMITGGSGFYQVDEGEQQAIEAGSWFCLYPGAVFNYGPWEGGDWDEYYFTVEGSRITEWLEQWLQDPGKVKATVFDDSLMHRMELIFKLMDSGAPSNMDRAVLMLESFLYDLACHSDGGEDSTRESFALKVIQDISQSLHVRQEAAEMASRHHISVSTLRRIVQEYTGYPLNEFLHRLRISEARSILLNTELTVKETGEVLGYKDTFYFSRVFKKMTGVSPRSYRNRAGP
ncbi:AraC family transcriptional regulator [Paenibacillus sp. JSM ZJ436]|uniref:AraC family transcriptional regulator n=1 Tax=Paenibacillus sp. JSM ZJ436 TaxID=3376190 RepID=UPI003792D05A